MFWHQNTFSSRINTGSDFVTVKKSESREKYPAYHSLLRSLYDLTPAFFNSTASYDRKKLHAIAVKIPDLAYYEIFSKMFRFGEADHLEVCKITPATTAIPLPCRISPALLPHLKTEYPELQDRLLTWQHNCIEEALKEEDLTTVLNAVSKQELDENPDIAKYLLPNPAILHCVELLLKHEDPALFSMYYNVLAKQSSRINGIINPYQTLPPDAMAIMEVRINGLLTAMLQATRMGRRYEVLKLLEHNPSLIVRLARLPDSQNKFKSLLRDLLLTDNYDGRVPYARAKMALELTVPDFQI